MNTQALETQGLMERVIRQVIRLWLKAGSQKTYHYQAQLLIIWFPYKTPDLSIADFQLA